MTSCVAVLGDHVGVALPEKGTCECLSHWTRKSRVRVKSDYRKVENKISHCLLPRSRDTFMLKACSHNEVRWTSQRLILRVESQPEHH